MVCANRFFNLAGNPIHALADLAVWQRWEVGLLSAPAWRTLSRFLLRARAPSLRREVPSAKISPSTSMPAPSRPAMLAAAARELRRGHEVEVSGLPRCVGRMAILHAGEFRSMSRRRIAPG
jgi:hypothetical protein